MTTHVLSRTFLSKPTTKTLSSLLSRSFSTAKSSPLSSPPLSLILLNRIRPLSAVNATRFAALLGAPAARGMATRASTASLNDKDPNWSNRPPKETILLDGCDFEHWLVVMEKPQGEPTRDEIIDSYIKTLAQVVGSEEEARMKIYSVSTRCYFAFGALVDEETSYKLKELPGVRWVLPDSYLDVKNKDYGGEPFINGQAVPYDPKYHEEWIRNNARANERNRRNDRPRNFDRSRNFERRRENMQNRDFQNQGMQNPASNMSGMPPNNGPPNMPSNNASPNNTMGNVPQNIRGVPQNNFGGSPPPPSNFGGSPSRPNNFGGAAPPPSYYGGTAPPPSNYGGMSPPPSNFGRVQQPPSNFGGNQPPPNHYGAFQPPPNHYGASQPPPNNYGASQPPPNNYGASQPPPNNYGATQSPPNNYGVTQPAHNYNAGNMGGMPPNAGWSDNKPGNVHPDADGPAYQNSYTPRQ